MSASPCYLCCAPSERPPTGQPPICASCAVHQLARRPSAVEDGPPPRKVKYRYGVPTAAADEGQQAAPALAPAAPFRAFLDPRTPVLEAVREALRAAVAAGLAPRHLLLSRRAYARVPATGLEVAGHPVTVHLRRGGPGDEVLIFGELSAEELQRAQGAGDAAV